MSTPDITPAQIAAYLTAIASACVVLFKLDLTDAQQAAIVGAISAAVALAFPIADSIIRHGRSRQLAPTPAAPVVNVAAAEPTALSPATLSSTSGGDTRPPLDGDLDGDDSIHELPLEAIPPDDEQATTDAPTETP
jgi:hypothetical protein